MKFSVQIVGTFHTQRLYDDRGRFITDVNKAVHVAEQQYGSAWETVFNGEYSVDRIDVSPAIDIYI